MSNRNCLGGINNYCLTFHTMKSNNKKFALKSYQTVKKALFFESISLINGNKFKYELWLTKE